MADKKKVVAGRVRQVVVIYSNNCMGIGLGKFWIDEWSSYRGDHIHRFNFTTNAIENRTVYHNTYHNEASKVHSKVQNLLVMQWVYEETWIIQNIFSFKR